MRAMFFDNLFRSLSWTLIHSLWQGQILTILAGLALCFTKKAYASVRYGILSLLLFLFVLTAGITFVIEWHTGSPGSPGLRVVENLANTDGLFHQSLLVEFYKTFSNFLNANSNWIVFIWLIILVIKSVSLILDLAHVSRLRHNDIYSPSHEWKIKLVLLSGQMGIRKPVGFMQSARLKIPAVVGYFKPMVLIPAGMLTQLPAVEVEAILLHELAHIRRHDYLFNFIQRLAELIFFFNPGLLWVSSVLRDERENCCDDLVISVTKNKAVYLNAIISFREYSLQRRDYVLGFFGNQKQLIQRMTRIVYNKNKIFSPPGLFFFICNLVVFVFLFSSLQEPRISAPMEFKTINMSAKLLPSFPTKTLADISQEPLQHLITGENHGQGPESGIIQNSESNVQYEPESSAEQNSDDIRDYITKQDQELNKQLAREAEVIPEKLRQRNTGKKSRQLENFGDQSTLNAKGFGDQEDSYKIQLLAQNARQKETGQIFPLEYGEESDKNKSDEDNRKQIEARAERLKQADNDLIQSKLLRLQFEKDRAQAESDRQQAREQRLQAEKDHQQAELDRIKSDRDREQAAVDRLQPEKIKSRAQVRLRL
jgi:bla regulator protein BlaR1